MRQVRSVSKKTFPLLICVLSLATPAAVSAAAGSSVSGIDVSLEPQSGGKVFRAKTDANGSFSFANLPPGRYILRLKAAAASASTAAPPARDAMEIPAPAPDARKGWRPPAPSEAPPSEEGGPAGSAGGGEKIRIEVPGIAVNGEGSRRGGPVVAAGIGYSATLEGATLVPPSPRAHAHTLEAGAQHVIDIGAEGTLRGRIAAGATSPGAAAPPPS